MDIKISPSVLACDFARLGQQVNDMRAAGADMIHLDVMDGHFVPNHSLGAPVIASLRKSTDIFFDTHLMITDPLRYIDAYAEAGSDLISFHAESGSDIAATIKRIKSHGIRAGLVLKPATPAEAALEYLEDLDLVLVMTVEPGFGGQPFMDDMLPKIRRLRQMADERHPGLEIEADGGISLANAGIAARNGCNVFVAGTSLFSAPDYGAAVASLRAAARDGRDSGV